MDMNRMIRNIVSNPDGSVSLPGVTAESIFDQKEINKRMSMLTKLNTGNSLLGLQNRGMPMFGNTPIRPGSLLL